MTFGFSSIGHLFATVAHDIVKGLKTIEHVLANVQASAPQIEAITAIVDPKAADIERAAFAVLGTVAHAVDSADAATSANGLNVALDAEFVAAVKAILPAIKAASAAKASR
jgi:hypothetical protein